MTRPQIDLPVVVVGAGPAGATLARLLALHQCTVILIDGGCDTHARLELIAPKTVGLFAAASLAQMLDDPTIARPCHGIVRTWRGSMSNEDFLSERPGCGYVVDRLVLDAALVRLADEAGASRRQGRVTNVRDHGAFVAIHLDDGRRVAASFVIDATGRAAAVARRLGARRLYRHRSLASRIDWRPSQVDTRLHVEGWYSVWRYALLGPRGRADAWKVEPAEAYQSGPCLTVDASSARLGDFSGERWLAIGDASLSFDPIASQGLGHAIAGALTAAGKLNGSNRMSPQDQRAFAFFNEGTWALHEETLAWV